MVSSKAQPPQIPQSPNAYPREELEAMVQKWLQANQKSEATKDWSYLVDCYHDDAEYRWTVGPGEEFVAQGKQQIADWAVGEQMAGFEGWSYPYERVLIDDRQGEVVGFWRQVSPHTRKNGETIEVAGIGGSWFRYGGDGKWSWQRDFFDLLSVFSAFAEIAEQGGLSGPVKQKLSMVAKGRLMNGHTRVRPKPSALSRVRQGVAMAKIFLTGR